MNVIKTPEWMVDALCAQTDPEVFFPDVGEPNRNAKRVCMACPVRAQCLRYAINHGMNYGVWGGKSYRERKAIAEQLDAANAEGAAA